MNPPVHPSAAFLRRHERRARGTLLAWSLALTVLALAALGAERLDWTTRSLPVALGAMGGAMVVLAAWFWQVRRLNTHRLAQELDARWALHARLETTVELAGERSAAAVAQREEAVQRLAGRRMPGAVAWFGALGVVAMVGLVLLAEGTALVWRGWQTRSAERSGAVAEAKTGTEDPRAAGERTGADTRTSISWRTPAAEIKATAIEEVPLLAVFKSDGGVRAGRLEIVVNGARTVSRALDAAELAKVVSAGERELPLSLYLDEHDVKPFDLVSYRLIVEPNGAGDGARVSSPMQFVQIRPVQRELSLKGNSSELATQILRLKTAQLFLLKQNFELAQIAGTVAAEEWVPTNTKLAVDQGLLAKGAEGALALARTAATPALVTGNLGQVKTLMTEAGEAIAAGKNQQAVPAQERALALLTELQQFIGETLEDGASVIDPFFDPQRFTLPEREETAAGKLEALAERQRAANAALAAAGAAGPGEVPALAAEQEAIARLVEELLAKGGFEGVVRARIQEAGSYAVEAAGQLRAGDLAAARVPAAAAQRALDKAAAAQEETGRALAVAALEEVRRTLNAAEREGSAAGRSVRWQEARTTLRAAAEWQQQRGSTVAARELAALVRRLGAPVETEEQRRAQVSALAQTQVELTARGQALRRAVRWLGRAKEDLAVAEKRDAAAVEVELAAQEAVWITAQAEVAQMAGQVAVDAGRIVSAPGGSGEGGVVSLGQAAVELAKALEQGRVPSGREAERGRRFDPAEVDPRYRGAVETYFERLSREGADVSAPGATSAAGATVPAHAGSGEK